MHRSDVPPGAPLSGRSRLILGVQLLGIAASYFLAAKLGLSLAFVAEQVTVVWPPTGIALAIVVLAGTRIWPGIWLGAFLANATANEPLVVAAGIATGNTLEALAGAWLFRRVAGSDRSLDTVRAVFGLVVLAAGLSTVVAATIGTVSLCLGGVQPWSGFSSLWLTWWLGDAMGDVLVASALIAWAGRVRRPFTPHKVGEFAALLVCTALVSLAVFSGWLPASVDQSAAYVIFPLLIWGALRFRQPGATLVSLAVAAVAIVDTVAGLGPFAEPTVGTSLVLLLIFLGAVGLTGLVLGAMTAERHVADRRRQADYVVAQVLADAAEIPDASERVLEAIGTALDWDLGALWMVKPDKSAIACAGVWPRAGESDDSFRDFRGVTISGQFPPGIGLPGRVWTNGRPEWVPDVVRDTNFPRAPFAARSGLHGGFAFPIQIAGETLGVMEFFSREVRQPDEELLRLMATIGSQLGQFIQRKRIEQERIELLAREHQARGEAEDAVRQKDELVATVSHDLRTPLDAMLGWTVMLRQGMLSSERAAQALETIERNARAQAQLIDDLLDMSRIMAGRLLLNPAPTDVKQLIEALEESLKPAAQAKEIAVDVSVEPIRITADAARLQQIVWNLLSNAVKFTPKGGRIYISARRIADEVVISVRDNGVGIDPAFVPNLFQRFRQADRGSVAERGGLGLGLAIVRHLVELHGGTVSAVSEGEGKGAEFVVKLPVAPASKRMHLLGSMASTGGTHSGSV